MQHKAIAIPPDPAVLAAIPASMIADTIERLIAELDARDGDPDVERNGDENDSSGDEGEPYFDDPRSVHGDGPGCLISDDDSAVDDVACDKESEDGI